MFVIYTPHISNRLNYVLDYVFKKNFNTIYRVTTDVNDYNTLFAENKINYSNKRIADNEFFIQSSASLLFETSIRSLKIGVTSYKDEKAIFSLPRSSDIPFDIFSAVFYMLSRYEEYLPFIKDAHDRYKPQQSIAYSFDFLKKPIVDIWLKDFCLDLNTHFNFNLSINSKYLFTPTIDVDIAYAYKSKGIYRSLFGFLRSLKQGKFDEIINRAKINFGLQKDPYDTFDYILNIHKKYDLQTIFFIHVGDYNTYDKSAPYKNSKFRSLIRNLSDYAEIGLHPSYASSTNPQKFSEEVERLSEIIKKDITKSRQHYLKLNFPNTYRQLIENNITDDYTMGYASEIGFRAGTSKSFNFFDLDLNAPTQLTINPFTFMEGTLRDYQNISADASYDLIMQQLNEVKNVNGHFISLFHNESLSDLKQWQGWRKVYESIIKSAK